MQSDPSTGYDPSRGEKGLFESTEHVARQPVKWGIATSARNARLHAGKRQEQEKGSGNGCLTTLTALARWVELLMKLEPFFGATKGKEEKNE